MSEVLRKFGLFLLFSHNDKRVNGQNKTHWNMAEI